MNVREASDAAVSKFIHGGISSLSEREQLMVALWGLEADVNNGGFDQYYFNSYGDFAVRAIHFLQRIGAANTARLLEQANSKFGESGPPADRLARQQAMERLPGRDGGLWADLDAEFWKNSEHIESLLAKHLGLLDA